MSWWRILLGLQDKKTEQIVSVNKAYIYPPKNMSACDRQKLFMHKNWDLFPEKVKDHIRRYDLIQEVMLKKDLYYNLLDSAERHILRCTNIAKECKEIGFNPYGIDNTIAEYESRLKESSLRLMCLPNLEELRSINYSIEQELKNEGWVCSYGTGGLHWNKKGVVDDGYAWYD